jgi:hypothetical protein
MQKILILVSSLVCACTTSQVLAQSKLEKPKVLGSGASTPVRPVAKLGQPSLQVSGKGSGAATVRADGRMDGTAGVKDTRMGGGPKKDSGAATVRADGRMDGTAGIKDTRMGGGPKKDSGAATVRADGRMDGTAGVKDTRMGGGPKKDSGAATVRADGRMDGTAGVSGKGVGIKGQ